MAIYLDEVEQVLSAAFVNRITVELVSEPGIGKSSVMKQIARNMAKKIGKPFGFVVRHLSTMDPTEVAGPMFITKRPLLGVERECAVNSYPAIFPSTTDTVFMPDGSETTIGELGHVPQFGIVFLDELRQAPHDVQKPAARFLDEHRVGEWALSVFGGVWGVTAASNRMEDRSGVNKELSFITNRKLILNVQSNSDVLANYYESNEIIPPVAIGYLRAFPGAVFTQTVPKDGKPFPTPRSFERTTKMLMTLGKDGYPACEGKIPTEIACGLMGEGRGPEYLGYLRCAEDMVKLPEILEAPDKCRIPDRGDVMWAVTQMMIYNAKSDNVLKLLTYLQRMPREMQLVGVASITTKVEDLLYNRTYAEWAAKNQQLLMAAHAADRRFNRK